MTRIAASIAGLVVLGLAIASVGAQTPPVPSAPTPTQSAALARVLDLARQAFDQGQYESAQQALADAKRLVDQAGAIAFRSSAVRVGGDIRMPMLIKKVAPVYPADMKAAGVQGTVFVEAVIDPQGNVVDPRVVRSVAPGLDDAALDAVRQWQYTPTMLGGRPVAVILTITINFSLQGTPAPALGR